MTSDNPTAAEGLAAMRVPEEMHVQFSDDRTSIRKWAREPFAGSTVFRRPIPAGDDLVEVVARAINDAMCDDLGEDRDDVWWPLIPEARAAIAAISPCAGAVEREWQPIATAPRDGTLVELVVDYTDGDHPLEDATLACTIGFNNFENDGEDHWRFAGWCWTQDHFTEGKGCAVAWRPSRLCASDDALPPLPARTPREG